MEIKDLININLISSLFIFLIGGIDNSFKILLTFIIIDYLTGIIKAIYKKDISSKIGIKGIVKKIGYIFIVIVAALFDRLIGDSSMAVRSLTIFFFASNEAISILENWGTIGLPLPKKLYQVFKVSSVILLNLLYTTFLIFCICF